jgi:hypothetical protein
MAAYGLVYSDEGSTKCALATVRKLLFQVLQGPSAEPIRPDQGTVLTLIDY